MDAFVDELSKSGVRHCCICPGSRSSPLSISFGRMKAIKKWVHLDERSAAFYALGISKLLGEPVALVCSSGTATANFLPAAVEATQSNVPLLMLTADRPPELQDWGALQTIDQSSIYGRYVKWSVNIPIPEISKPMISYIRAMANRAVATSMGSPLGPVHFNFPFREPLEPAEIAEDIESYKSGSDSEIFSGRNSGRAFMASTQPDYFLSSEKLSDIASNCSSMKRGLIICGPQMTEKFGRDITKLASKLRYPILADVLSQVRCGDHDRSFVIDHYDGFVRNPDLQEELSPEIIIRFGNLPVSKPLVEFLNRQKEAIHILVSDDGSWSDPSHISSEIVHADCRDFSQGLIDILKDLKRSSRWLDMWRRISKETEISIADTLEGFDVMFEGKIFSELSRFLPDNSMVFAGNSMPVRDMDSFFPSSGKNIKFLANRGASGIDGVVSTALGAAAVTDRRSVLILGDISFYHDMNGLLAAKNNQIPITIIVVNNNGGGIFSFLPQAEYPEYFEAYFGTPHELQFQSAAELYGINYYKVENWKEFRFAIESSLRSSGTEIIEIRCDRTENVGLHKKVWQSVKHRQSKS